MPGLEKHSTKETAHCGYCAEPSALHFPAPMTVPWHYLEKTVKRQEGHPTHEFQLLKTRKLD